MSKVQSLFDPSRENVGKIYRDLQMNGPKDLILNGDMTNEIMKGLVEDLNEAVALGKKEFNEEPFYIVVHEKKDLVMKSAIVRRLIKRRRRPYPEDDTLVFKVIPKQSEIYFCWCLPHWSEMPNMLMNKDKFKKSLIEAIIYWKKEDLRYFGFRKDSQGNWEADPNYKDKILKKKGE